MPGKGHDRSLVSPAALMASPQMPQRFDLMALSSRYAFAVVISPTPASSRLLRQRRTRGSVISCTVSVSKAGVRAFGDPGTRVFNEQHPRRGRASHRE
jgi:hypothetical protein